MPGGTYAGNQGGSNIREAFLVNIANAWIDRQNILDPIELYIRMNGMPECELRFRNTILVTLDTGSGTKNIELMIFSAEKWNKGAEIKARMKVNTSLTFEMMEAPLRNAYRLFLAPLLGAAMSGKLIDIYAEEDGTRTDLDDRLLEVCQRANANLAFWHDFDEISVRITDAGFQRQKSDNDSFQQVYKYQEDNLRTSFRNKGFNALDELLELLYTHIADYPEFAASQAYQDRRSAIIRNTADINDTCFINSSRIIFLRLQPHIRFAEEMWLQPLIGEELYEHLIDNLANPPEEEQAKKDVERLRLACARYIAAMAVRRLLMETGSITDRGLYFTSIQPGEKGNEQTKPVGTDRIAVQIQNLKSDADMYMTALLRTVRNRFEEFYAGDHRQAYRRDNDHKRTFWT